MYFQKFSDRFLALPWLAFLVTAWIVLVSAPARVLGERPVWLLALGTPVFAAICWWAPKVRFPRVDATRPLLERRALTIAIGLTAAGVALRVAWVCFVTPVQVSDFKEYWDLARNLLATGEYAWNTPGGKWYAYRAPGYTFFLAACMKVFGEHALIPAVTNTVLYAAASGVLYRMTARLAGRVPALVAVALFAIWPSSIALTGVAAYEALFTLLCLLSLHGMMRSERTGARGAFWAGVVNGLAVLVRPTVLLMPAVWALYKLSGRERRSTAAGHLALAALGMAAMVLPWTARNHAVGIPTTVSANGGMALFLAANPTVGADYDERAALDLVKELHWDERAVAVESGRRAKEFIKANPWTWLRNNVERQVVFLGDDSAGFYWSLRIPYDSKGAAYSILQAVAHVWWVAVWALALAGTVRARARFAADRDWQLLGWVLLLFVATAFPFCSVARYHMPFVPLALIAAGYVWARRTAVMTLDGRGEAPPAAAVAA